MEYPLKIKGAVLEESGRSRPYEKSRPITISELELEGPGRGEVLVKIAAAGLCHSDLSVVNNNRPRPLPMLLGHESAGVIEDLGPGVTEFEVGQHVVMTFLPRCGECEACQTNGRIPCSEGSQTNNEGTLFNGTRRLSRNGEAIQHHLGVSGFAEYAVVSTNSIVPIGSDVPAEIAAIFGCAILTGGGAILNEIKPTPGDSIAIVGLGGVGMAAVITAAALGVKEIIGIDTQQDKLETALELGATAAMTTDEALLSGKRFDAVAEAAGHPAALEAAFDLTKPGGTTVTVGLPAPDAALTINALKITGEARRLHGSYLGSAVPAKDIPIYEDLWRSGKLRAEGLISNRISLHDINKGMDQLADGKAIRQIITFDEEVRQ